MGIPTLKERLRRSLPLPVLSYLIEIRQAFRYRSRRSYAQFAEDVLIDALLPEARGVYVDVGAAHPIRGSNTYRLYARGWHGINIEPNPFSLWLFTVRRPRDLNLNCGIGEPGDQTYYLFSNPAYNTFDTARRDEIVLEKKAILLGTRKIALRSLRDIIKESGYTHIDLLTIDTEGYDLAVLQTNDWDAVSPKAVCVEVWGFDVECPYANPIYPFLTERGYRLHSVLGYSLLFKRVR